MFMKFFEYDHLPPSLQSVSKSICELAMEMQEKLPTFSDEKEAGMRKLLEAKDCFVRAELESQIVDGNTKQNYTKGSE